MKSSNEYLRCPECQRSIVISWSVFPATGFRFECPRCEIRSWPSCNIKKAWKDWTITHDSHYEIIRACGLTFESTDIRREQRMNGIYELLIELEMHHEKLGASLVEFLELGFDPDAHYTPCEIAIRKLCGALGFDYKDVRLEVTRRVQE